MQLRSLPCLLLALCAFPFAGSGAAQDTGQMGKVLRVRGRVESGPAMTDEKTYRQLQSKDPISEGTKVVAYEGAGTAILVGRPPAKHGLVQLGPNTRFAFERWVAELIDGERTMRVYVGQVLAVFWPETYSATGEHTVEITTPSSRVKLHGTAVFLDVAVDGSTLVYVREGTVTVTSLTGVEVTVRKDQQTSVAPGQPPTEPVDVRPGAEPDVRRPGEAWVLEPPLVDLNDPRLDLPK